MSKHSPLVVILLALIILLSACSPTAATSAGPAPVQPTAVLPAATEAPPAVAPTEALPAPTQAVEQPVSAPQSAVFVLFDKEAGMLRSYNLDGSLRFEAPAPELEFPMPETLTVLKDAVYYATYGADKAIYRASAGGTEMKMSVGNLSAFKVSPDEQWIAWSVLDMAANPPSSQLWIRPVDGGKQDAKQIASYSLGSAKQFSLIPLEWAADGSSLLFERSGVGMGGYILYGGHFSLYRYDLASGQIATIIAAEEDRGQCLDAFRPDLGKAAYVCGKDSKQISIRDLNANQEGAVPMLPEQVVAGSSAFSPSGQWLAYAAARSNPDDEAGQVAVVPTDLSAAPQVIFKVGQKRYPVVQGWLDEDTLLITIANSSGPRNTIMTIRRDGTDAREIASGEFIGWAK